jgi:hypothetical protein
MNQYQPYMSKQPPQIPGVKTNINYPLTKKTVLVAGGITFAIVIIILIVMIATYFSRSLFFAKYKAKPVSSITGESTTTKALGSESDYYYPNGRPDPETGLPPNSKPLPTGVFNTINANLTQYRGVATNSLNGWGFIPNS